MEAISEEGSPSIPVAGVCRKHDIIAATYRQRKSVCGGANSLNEGKFYENVQIGLIETLPV